MEDVDMRSAALIEAEQQLKQPDCVMEPNVLDIIKRYVLEGGQPHTVVQTLSQNYEGYAQMASLVCQWLKLAEDDGKEGEEQEVIDEAYFLRAFAKEKFNPDKFLGVFTRGGGGPPSWLDGLAVEKAGRQLIYKLSAAHKNCLLLNFAIQRILHRGHEDEVASVGSSLAGYFTVFHRLLSNRLRDFALADESQLDKIINEFKESVCHSQHTYCHAQMMLSELGQHPGGRRFTRLSQELTAYAAQLHGHIVWRMTSAFVTGVQQEHHVQAARLVADVLTHASSSSCNIEVSKLSQLYSSADPPPVSFLRNPWLLDHLIAALFTPNKPIKSEDVKGAYIHLVSVAATAVDERDDGGVLDLSDCSVCVVSLKEMVSFAHKASQGVKLGAEAQQAAEMALRMPCAALGLLYCMRCQLASADFWRESFNLSAVPVFLKMLAVLVPMHTLMHDKIVNFLSAALHVMGNSKPDLARGFLDVAVLLVKEGRVERIIGMVDSWTAVADPSLVRYFVFKLLGLCAPPYSQYFASAMVRLMVASGVKRSRSGQRDTNQLVLLEEFAAACGSIVFDPPLSAKQRQFLQELQMDRGTY